MRTGKLSPEKIDAIADAADVNPEAEGKLLEGAEKKPLGELCKDAEGAWNFRARGTVDDGNRFQASWERETDRQFTLARAEGREEPHDAADATGTAGDPTPTKAVTKAKRASGRTSGSF